MEWGVGGSRRCDTVESTCIKTEGAFPWRVVYHVVCFRFPMCVLRYVRRIFTEVFEQDHSWFGAAVVFFSCFSYEDIGAGGLVSDLSTFLCSYRHSSTAVQR